MDEVKINTSKTLTLTLPSDPASNTVSVSLFHEFGDLVSGPTNATRTGTGVYSITYGQEASGIYTLNASGQHRADFKYTIGGTQYTQSQYINVYTPYIDSDDFFTFYPELETAYGTTFDRNEKRARYIINSYCGQSFDYYPKKTLNLDGDRYNTLRLPYPIFTIRKVTADLGTDMEAVLLDIDDPTINAIEKIRYPFSFESSYGIRFKRNLTDSVLTQLVESSFKRNSVYTIYGDYGWRIVPDNVRQASALIIADLMNDDSEYRRHGITNINMDSVSFNMSSRFYESTGNIEADVLLMDYILFIMDYVV